MLIKNIYNLYIDRIKTLNDFFVNWFVLSKRLNLFRSEMIVHVQFCSLFVLLISVVFRWRRVSLFTACDKLARKLGRTFILFTPFQFSLNRFFTRRQLDLLLENSHSRSQSVGKYDMTFALVQKIMLQLELAGIMKITLIWVKN